MLRRLLVAMPIALLAGPGIVPARAAPGPQNGLIGYSAANGAGGLVVRRPSGRDAQRVQAGATVLDPVFSPRGRRVAFSDGGRLWVMYVDGSGLRALTDGTVPASQPSWSPDGTALAFTAGGAGAQHISVMRADGTSMRQLTYGTADRSPAWGPTNSIAFVRRTAHGGDELYAVGALGGTTHRLTRTRQDEESPAWSPAGRRIAFSSGRSGRRRIFLMKANGGKARPITDAAADAAAPVWSPNGKRMAMTVRDRRVRRVAVMWLNRGRPVVITRGRTDAGAPDWQPAGYAPVIAAAGDIACDPNASQFNGGLGIPGWCQQKYTSDILETMDLSAVLMLGDGQYADGRLAAWYASFDPTWGRLKWLMHPVPGNHEYRDPGAAAYFDYFDGPGATDGPAGWRGLGYYSFDVGTWHIIALNSGCASGPSERSGVDCALGSPQEQWLRADLAAHPARCTLAFWHHPLRSSGLGSDNLAMLPIWQDLYAAGVDVVLNGHDHAYERFAPQTPDATPDPVNGIRQFVVGTGGHDLQRVSTLRPNSEVRSRAFGVLQLTLRPSSYQWQFVSELGGSFTDSGTTACH
jgi:Calcineurin-like phosphoesterase/WD40-like Beta Propeller Repeat